MDRRLLARVAFEAYYLGYGPAPAFDEERWAQTAEAVLRAAAPSIEKRARENTLPDLIESDVGDELTPIEVPHSPKGDKRC
jgi:hypothetical protein